MNLEKIVKSIIGGTKFLFVPGSIMKGLYNNREALCLSENDPHYLAGVMVEGARIFGYLAVGSYIAEKLVDKF